MMKANELTGICKNLIKYSEAVDSKLEELNATKPCMLYKGIDSKGKGEYRHQEIQVSSRDANGHVIEDSDYYFEGVPVMTCEVAKIFRDAKKSGGVDVNFWTLFELDIDGENVLTDEEIEISFDLRGKVLFAEGVTL